MLSSLYNQFYVLHGLSYDFSDLFWFDTPFLMLDTVDMLLRKEKKTGEFVPLLRQAVATVFLRSNFLLLLLKFGNLGGGDAKIACVRLAQKVQEKRLRFFLQAAEVD